MRGCNPRTKRTASGIGPFVTAEDGLLTCVATFSNENEKKNLRTADLLSMTEDRKNVGCNKLVVFSSVIFCPCWSQRNPSKSRISHCLYESRTEWHLQESLMDSIYSDISSVYGWLLFPPRPSTWKRRNVHRKSHSVLIKQLRSSENVPRVQQVRETCFTR